jgi:hypothetical protein
MNGRHAAYQSGPSWPPAATPLHWPPGEQPLSMPNIRRRGYPGAITACPMASYLAPVQEPPLGIVLLDTAHHPSRSANQWVRFGPRFHLDSPTARRESRRRVSGGPACRISSGHRPLCAGVSCLSFQGWPALDDRRRVSTWRHSRPWLVPIRNPRGAPDFGAAPPHGGGKEASRSKRAAGACVGTGGGRGGGGTTSECGSSRPATRLVGWRRHRLEGAFGESALVMTKTLTSWHDPLSAATGNLEARPQCGQ